MSFCSYFDSKKCSSCSLIDLGYEEQLQQKELNLHEYLDSFEPLHWHEPVQSPLKSFRNKAKMVALPSEKGVVLGLDNKTSLIDCPLYPQDMQKVLFTVQEWLRELGIKAYDVKKKKGELKFVLLTRSSKDGSMMLRFVLRSYGIISRLKKNLKTLQESVPELQVISVNIQPEHKAILEGDEEIFLSEDKRLEENFNGIPLYIKAKSFFQTNPHVAQKLYKTASQWADASKPETLWDLFCGVGGFALHCTSKNRSITGIEIEKEAIECAKDSAKQLGFEGLGFESLDAADFSARKGDSPDIVIVNPPRRGLGVKLSRWLEEVSAEKIIYSSCSVQSLQKDLQELKEYRLTKVQLFDMFPHTNHYEVLVELVKK